MNRLSLYINNKKCDIGPEFQVSLNYNFTDIERPTAVKNSFSKTIELLGTKNNNEIFDRYFDTRHNIISFDPSERIPFTLYLNSDLLESGYCKLDNIKRVNDIFHYSITLYGGLGDFFYSLSSSTLEDLSTYFGTDVSINRQTVYNDWVSYVQADTDICWIPEYGGVFDDFNNDKIQFDQTNSVELPEELDQFQVGDFRSYLQRPGAYVSPIIEGICSQSGFDVSIDEGFKDRGNPYWENLVVSFPMLDLSEKGQRWLENAYPANSSITAPLGPGGTSFYLDWTYGTTKDFASYGVISPTIDTTVQFLVSTQSSDIDDFGCALQLCFYNPSTQTWIKTGDRIVFISENKSWDSKEHDIVIPCHSLETYDSQYKTPTFWDPSLNDYTSIKSFKFELDPIITNLTGFELNNVKLGFYYEGTLYSRVSLSNTRFNYRWANPENLHSDRKIHFNDIAHNGIKQSDFLLSWAKTFGLLFRQNKNTKKIDIQTRNSFFTGYKILDWTDKLDLSKELNITPLTFDSRYYSFKFNDAKSSYLEAYKKDTGKTYGEFLYDTEYEINSDTKNLLSDSVFTTPFTSTEYLWRFTFNPEVDGLSYTAKTIYDSRPRPSNFSWDGHSRKRENNEMQLYFRLNKEAATDKYWLSDDLPMMIFNQEFNYIYPGVSIAALYTKSVDYLPVYTDYISSGDDGFNENFSLQFSRPQKTYNGLSYSDSSATVYSRFWESYLTDLYNKNNKIVTAYFNLSTADILNFDFKNFIFCDGVIYHVNRIIDYNPLILSSTKVELVQVRDINAYVNGQRYGGSVSYYLTATRTSGTLDSTGGLFNPGFITNSASAPVMVYNSAPSMLSYNSNTQAITVSSYTGQTDRSGTMRFTIVEDSTVTVTINITQTAQQIEYYLTPSSGSASITWPAQTAYSGFSTNGTIVKSSGSSWLTVENNTIKAAANGNDFTHEIYSAERTGTIVVTLSEDSTKTSTVSVFQEASYFVRTHRNPNVNLYSMNVGTASYVDVDPQLFSNGTITYVGVDVNWLTWDSVNNLIEVNTNSGTSTRVGIVTFGVNEGTEELEFEIYQPGSSQYYITPTSTVANVSAGAQNVYQFTTNGSLMIDPTYSSTDASWLDLQTNIGGYTFVTCDENGLDYTQPTMSSQRVGTLHLTLAEDSNIKASITVTQAPTYYIRSGINNRSGATYTYDTDSSASGSLDPDLYTNTEGTVHYFINNEASTWLSYDPVGEMIYFTANTTGDERQGYVSFYIDESNDEQTFIIKQKGENYLRITNYSSSDNTLQYRKVGNETWDITEWPVVYYRQKGRSTWSRMSANNYITIPANSYVELKGSVQTFKKSNSTWARLYCNSGSWGLSGNLGSLAEGVTGYKDYRGLFYQTSLTTNLISAGGLIIPGNIGCYQMFYQNSNMVSGPTMLGTTVGASGRYQMFYNCSSLKYITSYATDISASNCLGSWLQGVGSNGVLTVPSSMVNQYPTGNSGIPSTWTYNVIS